MSRPPRRPLKHVQAVRMDKKRRLDDQRNDNAWEAGFSGTTITHKYQTVQTAAGSVSREVAVEVVAPLLPIPTVALPIPVGVVNWTHDEPAVPLAQCGSTSYVTPDTSSSKKKKKTNMSDWRDLRDEFGDELHRLDSRSEAFLRDRLCASCCTTVDVSFRCSECSYGQMLCARCMCAAHRQLPFHRLEKWSDGCFSPTSLFDLEFVLSVGHADGTACDHARAGPAIFSVIHTNGLHRVSIGYCGCEGRPAVSRQLMRCRLWPATTQQPRTAATFEVLRQFEKMNAFGHINATDFYRALAHLTDAKNQEDVPNREAEFLDLAHQWLHTKLLKRFARFLKAGGAESTQDGELAFICRSCPIPGINLPENWQKLPLAWLYRLHLALDANFRLSNRAGKGMADDPPLQPGSAFMVDPRVVADYVKDFIDEKEISTCSGFQAILLANLKHQSGLRTTGVGALGCRHEFWQPQSVVNLQKGERQCNMQLALFKSLRTMNRRGVPVLLSYDINCQFSVHLWDRFETLPDDLKDTPTPESNWTHVIPKMHITGHIRMCQAIYSLNFLLGCAWTCGECIERMWALMNGIALSTREMRAGRRADWMDFHMGHHNYTKHCSTTDKLWRGLLEAAKMVREHYSEFELLNEAVKARDAKVHAMWEREFNAWVSGDHNRKGGSPFQTTESKTRMTQKQVEKHLKDEAARAKTTGSRTNTVPLDPDVEVDDDCGGHDDDMDLDREDVDRDQDGVPLASPKGFIIQAMRLEAAQYQLATEIASAKTGTSLVLDNIKQRSKTLTTKLAAHVESRTFYMPAFTEPAQHTTVPAERRALHLPSSFASEDRSRSCRQALIDAEREIRFAALGDALADVTRHLRTRTFLLRYKAKQATGNRQNTRLRDSVAGVSRRIDAAAAAYRRHWIAYKALTGPGDWEKSYRPLSAQDVRGLSEKSATEQELYERYRCRKLVDALATVASAGGRVTEDRVNHALQEDDSDFGSSMERIDNAAPFEDAQRNLSGPYTLGEGHRKVSWIWMTGLQLEDVIDNQLTDSLRVEWSRARARRDRWMEEATLVSEEMRRNIAHCVHEHSLWLLLANTKVHRGCTDTTATDGDPPTTPVPDAAQEEGRRAYCLERARDEVVRAQQHAAKWLPLYNDLQHDELMRLLLIDPSFDLVATMGRKGKEHKPGHAADVNEPQQVVVELAEGLAMATLDDDYEVTYVDLTLLTLFYLSRPSSW